MASFQVRVDDPDMAGPHEIVVQATSAGAAVFEAAAQAILADRLGCGAGLPDGFAAEKDTLPVEQRIQHADSPEILKAVAAFATVVAQIPQEPATGPWA